MDNHSSHLIFDFVNYCQNHRIIPWCFPSKLTHRLQPLDGKPFQAYKHYYRRHNSRTVQWGGSIKEKADFLRQIHAIRMQNLKIRLSGIHSSAAGFGHSILRLFAKNFVMIMVMMMRQI